MRNQNLTEYLAFNPFTFEGHEIVRFGTPSSCGSMVYFIFIHAKGIVFPVYIGKTLRGFERIQEHEVRQNMPVYIWVYIPVPDIFLNDVEKYYIRKYRTCLNMIDNPDFMKKDGKYLYSKSVLHDIQKQRIEELNQYMETPTISAMFEGL